MAFRRPRRRRRSATSGAVSTSATISMRCSRLPEDDEPTTPEEDEGAREARAEVARGEVYSADEIKREIG